VYINNTFSRVEESTDSNAHVIHTSTFEIGTTASTTPRFETTKSKSTNHNGPKQEQGTQSDDYEDTVTNI